MKSIKCELCGSNDVVKKDDLFVCQYCGTKYTPEEAKKLLVEISGEVNVKNIGNSENYIKLAENAMNSNNNAEAENYCNKVIEIDAENYEAWFIKGKVAGWQSTVVNPRTLESITCFENAIKFAPEDKKEEMKKECTEEMKNLLESLGRLACSHYIDYPSVDDASMIIDIVQKILSDIVQFCSITGSNFDDSLMLIAQEINSAVNNAYPRTIYKEYVGDEGHPDKFDFEQFRDRANAATILYDTAISCIMDSIPDGKDLKIQIYKNKIQILQELVKCCSYTQQFINGNSYWTTEYSLTNEAKEKIVNEIMEAHQKIKEMDPSYVIPDRSTIKTKQGCYVATAVYGTYDCPEVWTLRRFRDYYLDNRVWGRAFIKLYYAVSPTIVKYCGKTRLFNKVNKKILDKWVKKLNAQGYESTRYSDKY